MIYFNHSEILTNVPSGILAVDGHQIIPLNAQVLKKRRKMMDEGTAVLTLVVNSDLNLVAEPQLSTFGLIDENEDLKNELKNNIAVALNEVAPERRADDNLFKDIMRHTIRSFLNEKFGKKPLMDIHLIRI